MSVESATPNFQDSWDPLDEEHSDPGMMVAAQRRELRNILKSYTGYYDIFSELIQNSLDAIDRRFADSTNFRPSIWISIDMQSNTLSVTDNGCGMTQQQFRQFLRPNLSFKQAETSRGNKGVGATYLGYGFNHLEVATRQDDRIYSGILRGGRDWVEDRSESIARPKVESISPSHAPFSDVSCGTSMVVQLTGKNIRPKDLTWIGADTAAKWLQVLRLMTPLGGVYLCGSKAPRVDVFVEVKNTNGEVTNSKFDEVRYLFP